MCMLQFSCATANATIPTLHSMHPFSYPFASGGNQVSLAVVTRMFAAGVQILAHASGGQLTQHAASATCPAPSPDQGPQSRTRGPTQATPPDPKPAVTCDTVPASPECHQKTAASPGMNPNQKKPSEAPVTKKKKKKKSKVSPLQPDQGDEAKCPDEGFSSVDASCAVRVVRACGRCGVTAKASVHGKLKECSTCRSVRYCGRECQKEDWPAHKATCKRLHAAQWSTSCCPISSASDQ
jgi:hypothetical protein